MTRINMRYWTTSVIWTHLSSDTLFKRVFKNHVKITCAWTWSHIRR